MAQLLGSTAAGDTSGTTPRNLLGVKDGPANAATTRALTEHVWADRADGATWTAGGTYLVARRTRILIESWDRASLDEQEKVVGRTSVTPARRCGPCLAPLLLAAGNTMTVGFVLLGAAFCSIAALVRRRARPAATVGAIIGVVGSVGAVMVVCWLGLSVYAAPGPR